MPIVNSILQSTDGVNNLGVFLDPGLLMDRQVSKLCLLLPPVSRLRSVCRSLTNEGITTHVNPRLCYELGGSLQRSPVFVLIPISSAGFSSCWTWPLGWSWTSEVQQHQLPFTTSFAGFQSGEWLTLRLPLWSDTAWLVLHSMELYHPVSSAIVRQCLWSASRDDLTVPRFQHLALGLCHLKPSNLELSPTQD